MKESKKQLAYEHELKIESLQSELSEKELEVSAIKEKISNLKRKLPIPDKTFEFRYALTVNLNCCDIWPDGDFPANPTATDVWNVVYDSSGMVNENDAAIKILTEWNFVECSDNGFLTITEVK